MTELFRNMGSGAKRGASVALFGLMMIVLAACGGGGAASSSGSGGGGSGGGSGGGGTAPPPTLVLALVDPTSNAARTSVAPGSPARLTATVRTAAGVAIPGALVNFSTDGAYGVFQPSVAGSPATATALTDANGVASVTLLNSGSSGAATITATSSVTPTGSTTPTALTATLNFAASAGVASVTLAMTDPTSGAIRNSVSPTSPARLTATVRGASGLPVQGVAVTFTTPAAFGTVVAGTSSVTDANGVVTATLNSATGSGSATVVATAAVPGVGNLPPTDVAAAVTYTATGSAGTPTISVVMTEPTSGATRTSISPSNPARVSATFRTATGAPIAGAVLTFSTDATLGTFTPASGTALTDSNGTASITLNSSSASGAAVVTARGDFGGAVFTGTVAYTATGSVASSATLTVTFAEPTPAANLVDGAVAKAAQIGAMFKAMLSGDLSKVSAAFRTITPSSPARVLATFRSPTGAPIPNAVITFTTDPIFGVFTPTSGTALTDASGVASVLLGSSTASGAATVTASGQTVLTSGTAPTTITGTAPYTVTGTVSGSATMVVSLVDQTTNLARSSVAPGSPARAVATIRTGAGVPIAGALVTFTTDAAYGVFQPSNAATPGVATALTDTNGVASVLLYNSATSGAATIAVASSVSVGGGSATTQLAANLNYSTTAGTAGITLTLTDPVSGAIRNSITSASPARLTATVRNASGLPASGVSVTLATPATFGTIVGGASAVTDANGVVTATLNAAAGTGSSTVSATAAVPGVGTLPPTNVAATVSYSATGSSGTPTIAVALTEIGSSATRTSVSPGNPARVSATFRDASGAPISGAVITFTTDSTLGAFSPASGTALTDASGVATITLNSSTASGAATVTASGQTTLVGATTPTTVTGSISYASTGSAAGSATLTVALVEPAPAAGVVDAMSQKVAQATAVFKSLLAGDFAKAKTSFRTITPGSPARVTATFRSPTGTPIAGAVITFATDPTFGVFTPSSGTALTDATGVASVLLGSSLSTGAATVTASGQTVLTTGAAPTTINGATTYTVSGSSGGALNLQLSLVEMTTTTARTSVSSGNPARVRALFRTSAGTPISGAVVTFTTDSTLGAFTPSNGTAITDSSGIATVTLSSATGTGTGNVTATTQTVAPGATTPQTVTATLSYAATGVPSLTLQLTDPATGAARTSVSSGSPARVLATVRNVDGTPAPGVVVTFTTNPALGVFSPTSATALTDASGVASIILNAAALTSSGAATVSASAQTGSGTSTNALSASLSYAVGAANVTLSPVTVATPNLSAFGTTAISVTVSTGGVPTSTPLNVTFSSPCASTGKAALTQTVATVNGTATASYRDIGCAGSDTITATMTGLTISSTGVITVAPPGVGSIQYVAANPTSISLRGTGGFGRAESSQVSFRLVDVGGNPLGGRTVNFSLNTSVGGITLSTTSAISDPTTGLVVTNVQSGNVSTPVRVTASTQGGTTTSPVTLSTQSDQLTITTGVPSQDGFSLSMSSNNIEGWNIDGTTATATVRLADHFRNPVPDGTAVNFTAEGGSIIGSCAVQGGLCSVRLTSQNFRPSNGRITLLAYAVGEEAFTDLNGNGWVDLTPTNEMRDPDANSTDLSEAFVDFNENGVRDVNEPFIDFNGNGTFDGPDGRFNGVLCDDVNPGRSAANSCSTTKTTHVRGSTVVVFSSSTPTMSVDVNNIALTSCDTASAKTAVFTIRDVNGNAMASGTTVTFTSTNGRIVSSPTTFTVPNTTACINPGTGGCPTSAGNLLQVSGAAVFSASLVSDDTAAGGGACTPVNRSGQLTATVRTPSGATTSLSIPVTD